MSSGKIRIMELRGTYKGGGGPDKTILLSAQKHRKDKFFILVTYLRNPHDNDFQIGARARELGIESYVEVIDRNMFDFKCLVQLYRLIKKYKIQIVHVHDLKTTLLGVLLKPLIPTIKIMHTAHGWIINSKVDRLKQKIQFFLLKFYPFHIAVSKATQNILIKNGITASKIKVLYNAIDEQYWKRDESTNTNSFRQEFGINGNVPVIGTIGRICKEKDLGTFLQVAKNVLNIYPDYQFFIVGGGVKEEVEYVKNLIKKMGLNGSVILTGHRTDLKNIYVSLDVFLMTSLTEGLPNTVLEAMALEIPIIATRVGGVPEIIIHNKTGILCEPGDIDGISKTLLRIQNNEKLEVYRLAKNSRIRIENCFSFDIRLKKIEEIYNNFLTLLNRKGK